VTYYLGLWLICEEHNEVCLAPSVTAFGTDADEVIASTESRFQQELASRSWARLRFYVLELTGSISRPLREWVIAPAGVVATTIDHTTGEVVELRVEEVGSEPSRPGESCAGSTTEAAKDASILIGAVSSPFDAPLYLGVRQVMRPQASVSILPPEVLAIGLDRAAVEARTEALYRARNRASSLCTVHYWVLERHRIVTVEVRGFMAAPDDVLVVDHDAETGEWRNAKTGELLWTSDPVSDNDFDFS
jgi:hypothetical protein